MWAGLGCGASDDAPSLPPLTSGEVDEAFPDTLATSVAFERGTELSMVAGQTAELVVQVQPPGQHTVRFALLGKTDDAFLSESIVPTGADGVARTSLTALAAASSFTVRAAAGRVSSTLEVVTLAASEATLIVEPNYGGSRDVERWVASVHLGTSCSALQGVPFPDGRLLSSGSGAVRLEGIPAEMPLAVVIRAEEFAGGCRSVTPLRANTEESVTVDVMDRPIQTEELTLAVSFGVESTEAPNPALDELAFRAVSPLAGGANDDLAALLDAMSAVSDNPAAFEQARAAQGWRAALVDQLDPGLPGTGLRTLVQNWMRSGLRLLEEPGALRGTLTSVGSTGSALLELTSVTGQLSPAEAGFEPQNTASLVAETDDFLRLGATLSWRPSPFLSAAANRSALSGDPERTSAADAMASEFGCDDVARIIVSVGTAPGQAFPGCDEACAVALCRSAMTELWARVEGSDLPAVPWQISGASRAEIDAEARPTRIQGNWIGTLAVPDFGTTPIGGPYSGVTLR